jgi:hypothetical protein
MAEAGRTLIENRVPINDDRVTLASREEQQ